MRIDKADSNRIEDRLVDTMAEVFSKKIEFDKLQASIRNEIIRQVKKAIVARVMKEVEDKLDTDELIELVKGRVNEYAMVEVKKKLARMKVEL